VRIWNLRNEANFCQEINETAQTVARPIWHPGSRVRFRPQTSLAGLAPGNIQLPADQRLSAPDSLEGKQRLRERLEHSIVEVGETQAAIG
jgi:hypothetical protein